MSRIPSLVLWIFAYALATGAAAQSTAPKDGRPATRPDDATTDSTADSAASRPARIFEIGASEFLLDGQPFLIRSGEMHAARVPREYWRHRLQMIRAMGCNTVCAYLFWNQHEPRPGEFNFKDDADCAEYCRIAQDVGLHVILRPGPYSCAEWDFGGFPPWLLKTPGLKLRTRDPQYLDACRRYLQCVGQELAPLQVTRGGPILMVQVENEYGSYGDDKEYIGALRDVLREAGFEVPMFTCDGPSQLPRDTRDDIFCVVNFGGDPEKNFEALRKVRPTGPLMCGEYYPGWFDSWGKPHHTGSTEKIIREIGWMLEHRASFSIYMAHGGTSFGFTAGANSPPFSPQTTSYDYDAPIDEAGRATLKFHALRELFAKHLNPGESLPEIPPPLPLIEVPETLLTEAASLFTNLPAGVREATPRTLEMYNQPAGLLLYRKLIGGGAAATVRISAPHDYVVAYLDANPIATLDRRYRQSTVELPAARTRPARLDLLVDTFGRVNYGPDLADRKGITERVDFILGGQMLELRDWEVFRIPLTPAMFERLQFRSTTEIDAPERAAFEVPADQRAILAAEMSGPAFFRGAFSLEKTGDTFLDLRDWSKGVVWINGHNLGRYWRIGPQQTLYLPGCWLKPGKNEIMLFELQTGEVKRRTLRGLAAPILNELLPDPLAPKPARSAGQTLSLAGLVPVHTAEFAPGTEQQSVRFAASKGRFVCIEALSPQRDGEAFATIADLQLLDGEGRTIRRDAWRAVYADSEELIGEDGRVSNAIDDAPGTHWHTQWQGASPSYPHQVVLDLQAPAVIGGLEYTPRQGSPNGRIKGFRVFVSESAFPGL